MPGEKNGVAINWSDGDEVEGVVSGATAEVEGAMIVPSNNGKEQALIDFANVCANRVLIITLLSDSRQLAF